MTTLDLSRRNFLRGAAIAGGSALALSTVLAATPAAAGMKLSQRAAGYQGNPKGAQSCATCKQFASPDACKIVDGKVAAAGWCSLWSKT